MNNQPASKWGSIVIQATKIAPTVWPLVFAAVVGSTVKAVALWKAEQGTTLGVSMQDSCFSWSMLTDWIR